MFLVCIIIIYCSLFLFVYIYAYVYHSKILVCINLLGNKPWFWLWFSSSSLLLFSKSTSLLRTHMSFLWFPVHSFTGAPSLHCGLGSTQDECEYFSETQTSKSAFLYGRMMVSTATAPVLTHHYGDSVCATLSDGQSVISVPPDLPCHTLHASYRHSSLSYT